MKYATLTALIAIICLLAACKDRYSSCVYTLKYQDARLDYKLDSLRYHKSEVTPEVYRASVEDLRNEEQQVYQAVRDCHFDETHQQEYYYWHQGRMWSPSEIEKEWQKVQ